MAGNAPAPFHVSRIIGTGQSHPADVLQLRRSLQRLGHGRFPPDPARHVTPGLMEATAGFQRAFELVPDSVVAPGGPTERALAMALDTLEREGDTALADLRGRFARRAKAGLTFGSDPDDRLGGRWQDGDSRLLTAAQADAVVESNRRTPRKPVGSIRQERKGRGPLTSGTFRRGAEKIGQRAGQPVGPGAEDATLREAEDFMRGKLKDFRAKKWQDAADNLQRYLSGTGERKTYTREQARAFGPIAEAEKENRKRFETRTFLGITKKNAAPRGLKTLRDGETLTFGDDWSKLYDEAAFLNDLRGSDRNFALAHGQTSVRSEGAFTATRRGDRIEIEGTVTHTWDDEYDFHRGQPGKFSARVLEPRGKAKPFRFGAKWQQEVRATVRVKNGRLTEPQVEWRDAEPET